MRESSFEQMPTNEEEIIPEVGQKLPPETHLEGQESVLIPEQALEEEKGVLRKLERLGGGKMKRIIASLMLGSALVLGAGAFEASAGGKKLQMRTEQEVPEVKKRSYEEKPLSFIRDLYALSIQNPRSGGEAQERIIGYMIKQAQEIGKYVDQLTMEQRRRFLTELLVAVDAFVDEEFGNRNGKVDTFEETEKRKELLESNSYLQKIPYLLNVFKDRPK